MNSGRAVNAVRVARATLLGLVAFGLAAASDLSAQRSLEIGSFDAVIEVGQSGSIEVRETIQATFVGSWNGIYRRIPVEYRTPSGFRYRLNLDVESVTDESGQELERWVTQDHGYRQVKIRVPAAVDATRSVTIRYSVANGLRFFEEHDELYWNVTGTEWDVPIRHASARVVLPDQATGIRSTAFTGAYGATEGVFEKEDLGNEIFIQTANPLEFREGLTVVVGWDPGVVSRPGPIRKAFDLLRANWFLLFPLLSFGFFHRIWSRRGRDPQLGSITTQYDPPDGLGAAQLGTLIDNKVDRRDITAIVVDLAVRGYLRIEQREKEGFLKMGSETVFVRTRPRDVWDQVQRYEREVLEGLFNGEHSDEATPEDLESEFYVRVPEIQDNLYDTLLEKGFYDARPDKVRAKWVGLGLITGVGLTVLLTVAASKLFMPPWIGTLAGIGAGLPALIFGWLMPARTVAGTQALQQAKGFEEFLGRVDADRIKRMNITPETFEALLPYAMALGLEKKWAKAWAELYREPPNWYSAADGRGFHVSSFVGDLSNITSQTGSAMMSQPRSSGSSGFGGGGGGGGFSGGGFGGGGGGGW